MDDNRIEIVARLDTSKAAVVKIEADLSKIADQIDKDHALKIIANVDLSKTTQRINSQLATIGKNLNVNVGNINLDANINTEIRQIETLGEITAQTKKEIEELKNNLANISGDYLNPIEPKISTEGYIDANATMNALKEQLSSLGTVTVTGSYGILEETQALESMTAEIKATSGEIRTLTFVWNEWDKAFEVTTGKYSDKGIGKIQQDIVRLEKELANFKASHQAIQTGLIQPLTEATNAIKNLKTGTGSIETAQKALDNLKTEAAKIGANLKSTGSSFNIFDNATNKAQNFDNTIKELGIDIGKLQFTDKKSGLAESLDLAKQKLEEFRRVEGESGKGLEWSQRYAEINSLLQSVTNNLKAAKKEESEIDAFNRKLDAHNQEIQKKLDLKEQEIQKAKELNEVEMQNYWQGRFEDSVKGITAENQILKDMKKYYEDLNNEAIKAEKQQAKDENRIANLQNRISRLAAEVNRYGEANERATKSMQQMSNGKTFAVEWSRITTEMAKGADLTDRELKDLSADMAVFRKEAQAAGLAGETAFGKFLNSFKTMSSYITANMVFNFVKRQVRELVNEVTEVDTAMTELRKVTEAPDKEFEAFAVSAGKTGRELGASVSDVINATAEFARLGESLPDAEELGRVATLYKNVGDGISADTAAEDIISTMKAFKIEAKDAITIVDKFNEVGNNFAISSGGIGEALKRSASALAAGNNDLSESIALITTANTVAQDSVAVGQGLKTASLRIRSTKADLEAMGEDAEGAAESTSKLRKELLALTGVDIQIDENTYKSTYNILLEISKVWRNLTDLQRSTVLEDLFGKRQANIGAAILENGDLLERVYKTSEGSMGSAMREQEEYAKSIQYSIDTLKAAYQDFADSVINSDFVKNLLGIAQSFLEVLTKIIDKFGTLPTILTGIAAIGGIKGVGIFGNLNNGLATVSQNLDKIKQVANYDFGSLYKKYNIDIKGLDAKDINALQNYINLLGDGKTEAEAFAATMGDATQAAKAQTTNFNSLNLACQEGKISQSQYATATQNLSLTQKTATATSKALSIALNTLANIGIMVAINLAIKGISALVDKLVVTKEELAEIRDEAVSSAEELKANVETFVDEADAIGELVQKYKEIHLSVSDINESKEELIQIQTDLIDKFGGEASGIDLVNGKYEEQIDAIERLSQAKYNEWKRENATAISRAQKVSGYNVGWYNPEINRDLEQKIMYSGSAERNGQTIFFKDDIDHADELAASLYKIKDVSEDIQDIYKNVSGVDFIDRAFSNDLLLSGTLEDARDQLGQIIDGYLKLDTQSSDTLKALENHYKALNKEIEDTAFYMSMTQQYESTVSAMGDTVVDETNAIKTASGELRKEFYESLDELQKGALADIDKIKSAMQSLAEGNKLSSSDFWTIAELDKDRILSDIQSINGEFTVSIESLMNLKDSYIKEQIKAYEDKISQIKADHKEELAEMQDYAAEISQLENEITEKNIDINQTVFGNIDTNSRQILEWTDENLEKYKDAIESWGATTDDLAGSISTVFGTYGEFDGVDIAFSPILQTQDGAVLLTEQTVNKYIFGLIEKAGEGWTNEDLLRLDTRGLEIDGVKIKNLIADIGATAAKTSEAMHYVGNSGALSRAQTSYSKINDSAKDYLGTIKDCNLMIEYLNSLLGNTVDKQKAIEEQQKKLNEEIKKAQEYADNLLKAQEYKIDQIIDGHQRELDSLNAEKEVLQDELDALNDQKDTIEDIIKNYESVNSLVQDTVQKEIDSLNEQKKAIEDTYNKRIEALKTENEEREDALEYAQKLANLENAKNNKVRVIDATRGFRYESVKEDVAKAQSDLDSFENAQAIKALEKARDAETKVIDDVIEEKEKYSKSWADILDTIKTDEDELLAAEILGADWREKIAQGDTELMVKFRTEYLKHNTNLKTLTNTEIKLKEAAIKAKDEEINAKNEQIKKWKEYKTEVQNAAKEIKDANDGYLSQLSTVELDETSSLERRQANLDAFKTAYTNALSTVVDLQNQLGGGDYYYTMHVENTDELEKAANEAAKLAAASAATYAMADEVKKRHVQNAGEEIAQMGEDIIKRISGLFGYSDGGVADYTGLAMLHGRKSAPETIFNANDSAKLYEMVHNTPNLMADMIDKATKISGFNLANASNNTQNSNGYTFYIDKIVTDNPQDFAKQLDRYYKTKLTESYTK